MLCKLSHCCFIASFSPLISFILRCPWSTKENILCPFSAKKTLSSVLKSQDWKNYTAADECCLCGIVWIWFINICSVFDMQCSWLCISGPLALCTLYGMFFLIWVHKVSVSIGVSAQRGCILDTALISSNMPGLFCLCWQSPVIS